MRGISSSLAADALRMEDSEVDLAKAKLQHENYKNVVCDFGLKLFYMEADDSLPDCVFVEDPVVVVGNHAVVSTLGHVNRRNEKTEMVKCLEKIPNLKIFDMHEIDCDARLDGGDVLYTGHEMFVGISSRTNMAAIKVLKKCFDGLMIHAIPVESGLHLKSVLSLACVDTILCCVQNENTIKIVEDLKKQATHKYKYIEMNGPPTKANVVYFECSKGSVLLHQKMETESEKKALDSIHVDHKVQVDSSELSKVDGCLTCCTVLLTV